MQLCFKGQRHYASPHSTGGPGCQAAATLRPCVARKPPSCASSATVTTALDALLLHEPGILQRAGLLLCLPRSPARQPALLKSLTLSTRSTRSTRSTHLIRSFLQILPFRPSTSLTLRLQFSYCMCSVLSLESLAESRIPQIVVSNHLHASPVLKYFNFCSYRRTSAAWHGQKNTVPTDRRGPPHRD